MADHQWHQHIFQYVECRNQMVKLKHETDGLIAQTCAGFIITDAGGLAEQIKLA